MLTKPKTAFTAIYQLKVTLRDTHPPIWRRLLVPADLKLAKLHAVLQIALGWTNSHLYEFTAQGKTYSSPNPEDYFDGPDSIDDRKVALSEVLPRVRSKLVYIYDMGDYWQHDVVLEKILPVDPAASYPACVDGKRACPPEDCGSTSGYYDFVEAIRDPEHEQHAEMLEWCGGDYDPEAFSVEDVNRQLSRIKARRRADPS
jgi:hypothetical protein